jgi:hypothetical protein
MAMIQRFLIGMWCGFAAAAMVGGWYLHQGYGLPLVAAGLALGLCCPFSDRVGGW